MVNPDKLNITPDYVYDPDEGYLCDWNDRRVFAEELSCNNRIKKLATVYKGPSKWVVFLSPTDSECTGEYIRWFDSLEEAQATVDVVQHLRRTIDALETQIKVYKSRLGE